MASSCSRLFGRTTLSSLRSIPRSAAKAATPTGKSSSPASPLRRFSSLSRLPAELGCAQSLLPLHSVVAAARLTSCLSLTSRNCRALSQGSLCCTSPGL